MEFQTLRKSHKKQIIIGALAVCVIGGALTFNLTRAKYKITEEIPLVKGNVNYSVPDLRVVAIKTSEDGTNYTDVSDVPASGYTLNTTNSICKIATTDTKDENITIEYSDGKVNFLGVGNKNTRCYLYFDKKDTDTVTVAFGDIEVKRTTPDFSQVATLDEGIYAVEDGMYGGTSYYWRGAVTNNYVRFANFCWRIIRINGDGSIRLIYDGTTCHANGISTAESIAKTNISYNSSENRSEYVGYTFTQGAQRGNTTQSKLKIQNEIWYSNNISGTNAQKVADGKFCNDRNTVSGSTWSSQPSDKFYYAAYRRLLSKSPTLSCLSEDVYTMQVGTITMDEVVMAGGANTNNTSYYLYNGQDYWTMSPAYFTGGDYSAAIVTVNALMFVVTSNGWFGAFSVTYGLGLRPVINLKADTAFKLGGNGTQSNPYVVAD